MHSKHKLANAAAAMPGLGHIAALTAIPMVMGAGAAGAEKLWGHFTNQRAQAKGFKEMLDMHPQLREARDPVHVQRTYNSMFRANPEVASDPFVIGTIVSQVVQAQSHLGGQEGPTRFLLEYERLRGLQPRSRADSGLAAGVREYSKSVLGEVKKHDEQSVKIRTLEKADADRKEKERLEQNAEYANSMVQRFNRAAGNYRAHRQRGGAGEADLDEAANP